MVDSGDQRGTNGKDQPGGRLTRGAEQPDGVMQLVRVLEIHGQQAPDSLGVDIGWRDLLAERERREYSELGARVITVHVGAGIGFGIAQTLRFLERPVEGDAALFDLRQDIVAGAVQDSVERGDAIAGMPSRRTL